MIPAHPHAVGIDHVLLDEDRQTGGPAPHVDAGGPQFLFILDKAGDARHIGAGGNARQFQIAALDTVQKVLHHIAHDRQQVHVHRQPVPDLPARIAKARPVVQRKVHRLGVEHLAPWPKVRHIAGGQHAADVLFADHAVVQVQLARQAIAAR